jgi:hypothetical protein
MRLLLLLCVAHAAYGAMPFVHSPWYHVVAHPVEVSGNVADPSVVARIKTHVSFKGEVIVFAFNAWQSHWVEMAVHMALQLWHVGFSHWVAVAPNEGDCNVLRLRAPGASCVWTTVITQQGTEEIEIQRYHVASVLAEAGLNVLHIDLDVIFERDPYPDLNRGAVGGADLVHMMEGWANGGIFYLRGTRPGNAAAWTHAQVVAMAVKIIAVQVRGRRPFETPPVADSMRRNRMACVLATLQTRSC